MSPLYARSKRGQIGSTWWSRTFVDILEHSSIGGRLQRGKAYARGGRVLWLQIGEGQARGEVQGSEPRPYDVVLTLDRFTADDVAALVAEVAKAPFLISALTSGTLPTELNQLAERLELALLPRGPADIHFSCTCPDWGEPCKHASALTYLLAEHVDDEPFDLLTLHGVDRAEFVARVLQAGSLADTPPAEVAAPTPTAPDPAEYFRARGPFPAPAGDSHPGALDALDHRLLHPRGPSITFWLGPHYSALRTSRPGARPGQEGEDRV